jgi:chromate reductase, NAD(P)H dehydrogenase (quinone)
MDARAAQGYARLMEQTVRILGISGSLRKASFNTALLRAATELVPERAALTLSEDIGKLPLYNDDLREAGPPPEVLAFRAQIASADAVLIVSPEYNFSIPGPLKNAIDWASRPPDQPFNDKPLAIMGASPGMLGTGRMQYHLRQVAVFLNMHVVNRPEVFVAKAGEKFDAGLKLTDAGTRKVVADLLLALRDFTLRLRGGR